MITNRFFIKIMAGLLVIFALPVQAELEVPFFFMALYNIFIRHDKADDLNDLRNIFGNTYQVKHRDGSCLRQNLDEAYSRNAIAFDSFVEKSNDPGVRSFAQARETAFQVKQQEKIRQEAIIRQAKIREDQRALRAQNIKEIVRE